MARCLTTRKDIDEYLCKKDTVFIEIISKCKFVKIELAENYFIALVKSIIGQQLSNKVANVIFGRLYALCNNNISPEIILELQADDLRGLGLSYSKINYIKNLSEAVLDKKVIFEDIENMENDNIIKILTSVKGIGQWTAEMFLIFVLGREDVFSCGDGGLQRAIATMYNIEYKLTKKVVNEISDVWKPYRTYASLYLWDLINKNII